VSVDLSFARELSAALLLVGMGGASLVVAWVVAARLSASDALLRAAVAVLLLIAQPIGISLLLAMVGGLWLPLVLIAHVLLAAVVVRRLGGPRWGGSGVGPVTHRVGAVLVAGATGAYVGLGTYLSLTGGRSREFDTQDYHLTNLATWLRSGDLWGLPYAQPGSVTATHPSNGELLGTWLALPTHGDELVYLVPLLFGVLAILGMALLVRELRPEEPWAPIAGAAAALAVLTAPVYFVQLDSLLTDLVAAACVVTAVALLLVARRVPATWVVVMAGVALGLGLGSKYTAVIPTAAVVVAAAALLRNLTRVAWLVPGTAAFAAPWFVRNIVTTGNPLFPQDLKVVDGSETPYDILNTSMLHHLVDRNTSILASWVRLGGRFVGPVVVLLAAGLVVAAVRAWRDRTWTSAAVLAALVLVTFLGYAATPVTGGGPDGLAFIITSCFRYALIAVMLGAALGTAMLGWRIAAPALALVLSWNTWRIFDQPLPGRPEVHLGASHVLVAVGVGALAALAAVVGTAPATSERRLGSRPALGVAAAAVVALAGLVGLTGAIHHNDRGHVATTLESLMLSFGPSTPAVPVGVTDLRALLGPRLERPLVRVSRGGAAEEIPFADENQLRRRVLGDADAPPPPPELARELDAAIDATRARLLVVSLASPLGFPDGWVPDAGWCVVGGDGEGTLFVRPELLGAGVACTSAAQLVADQGGAG
jgi:hypothetical protein